MSSYILQGVLLNGGTVVRVVLRIAAIVVLVSLTTYTRANPMPSPAEQMYPFYSLVKTLPFNYSADLVALLLALLVLGQTEGIPWRLVPVYNLVVVVAGYLSDWGAGVISGYPAFSPSTRDPFVGFLLDPEMSSVGFTFGHGAGFMAAAGALIFLSNLAIIHYILHLNDVEHGGRLPFAAAIMAVLTSPYIALRGDAKAAWVVPTLMTLLGLAVFILTRQSRNRRKPASRPQHL